MCWGSGCITASEISKATNIHPQDVYKILLALEKKGLLLRTFNKPVTVEAIPLKEALNLILECEKEKSKEKLQYLNKTVVEIEGIYDKITKVLTSTPYSQDAKVFVLQTQDLESARGKIDATFEKMKTEYDLVVPVNSYKPKHEDAYLKQIAKRGVKIRILVITGEDQKAPIFIKNIEISVPHSSDFELRSLEIDEKLYFAIIDSKEAWFRLASSEEDPDNTSVLVTDSKGMVTLANYVFETLWNDRRVKVLTNQSGITI